MSALAAIHSGHYTTRFGQNVIWRDAIETARARKKSVPPDADRQSSVPQSQLTLIGKRSGFLA